eukprot:CAMPEP_0174751758 /NCGR_PEP_ID=MMETSP1094-20130205/100518_1 /TAXON_ID=156173 /ORGANISM="Chrysochromulina brevifilum, Strain UTEX LB 985" /LENGTH=33 /DNA_ID= /DNA_START= /DNA_END= /DNA_ORIENTATION=
MLMGAATSTRISSLPESELRFAVPVGAGSGPHK